MKDREIKFTIPAVDFYRLKDYAGKLQMRPDQYAKTLLETHLKEVLNATVHTTNDADAAPGNGE